MNPLDFVKNFSTIQEKMKDNMERVASISATGSSGGNMVQITLNGKFEIIGVHLDPICVDNRDVKMLEDLIQSAHHDALVKIQAEIQKEIAPIMSQMNFGGTN